MLSFFSFRRTCWLGLPVLSVLLSSGLASAVTLESVAPRLLDMATQGAGKVYIGGAWDNTNISAVILRDATATQYLQAGNPVPFTGLDAVQQATYDAWNPLTGAQDGPSGIFSQTGAADGGALAGVYGIGFATGPMYGWDSFGGKPVDISGTSKDLVIRETYLGDTTLKGYVDVDNDYNNWFAGWTNSLNGSTTETWATGDFLHTGVVDVDNDYNMWFAGWTNTLNGSSPNLPPGNPGQAMGSVQAGSVAAVPEPATLALLVPIALVGLYAAARRRRGL